MAEKFSTDSDYIQAQALVHSGKWREAEKVYSTLLERYPNEPELLMELGNVLYSQGLLVTSISQYEKALELNPEFSYGWYKLGVCLFRAGQMTKALDAFAKVSKTKGETHVMAAYFEGLISFFMGRDSDSVRAFDAFREQSPESKISNYFLAQLEIKNQNYARALELLEDLCVDTPELAEAQYLMGQAYYGMHKNLEAVKCYRKALELNPEDHRSKAKLSLLTDVEW